MLLNNIILATGLPEFWHRFYQLTESLLGHTLIERLPHWFNEHYNSKLRLPDIHSSSSSCSLSLVRWAASDKDIVNYDFLPDWLSIKSKKDKTE